MVLYNFVYYAAPIRSSNNDTFVSYVFTTPKSQRSQISFSLNSIQPLDITNSKFDGIFFHRIKSNWTFSKAFYTSVHLFIQFLSLAYVLFGNNFPFNRASPFIHIDVCMYVYVFGNWDG